MKYKKAVSISIMLLVISSLILTSISLMYFANKEKIIAEIDAVQEINKAFLKKAIIDFYLDNVFEKTLKDLNFPENKFKVIFEDGKIGYYSDETSAAEAWSRLGGDVQKVIIEIDKKDFIQTFRSNLKNYSELLNG